MDTCNWVHVAMQLMSVGVNGALVVSLQLGCDRSVGISQCSECMQHLLTTDHRLLAVVTRVLLFSSPRLEA